jgi:hypothetical protein
VLPGIRIEQTGFGERNGKNGTVTVDDVEPDEEWNAEARLLHGEALQGMRLGAAPDVQQVADTAGANALLHVAARAGTRNHSRAGSHGELSDLLLEGHRGEQTVNGSHTVALR